MKSFFPAISFVFGICSNAEGVHGVQHSKVDDKSAYAQAGSQSKPDSAHTTRNRDFQFVFEKGFQYRLVRDTEIDGTGLLGRELESRIGLKGRIGARLQIDGAAFLSDEALTNFDSGLEFRRGRVYTKGELFFLLPATYRFELDVVADSLILNQNYFLLRDFLFFDVFKFGHYKAPYSLESLTSSRDITFMEQAAPVEAFAPGTKWGFHVEEALEKSNIIVSLGWFADGDQTDIGDATQSLARIIGRITWNANHRNHGNIEKDRVTHVGLNLAYAFSGDSEVRYRARPESHLAPRMVDTGAISAENSVVVGGEFALTRGSTYLQGEYFHSFVGAGGENTIGLNGAYIYGGWFLTGENRPYEPDRGIFGQLKSQDSFLAKTRRGGAWEVAARLSYVDLNDQHIRGGRLFDFTVGINAYVNPRVLVKFNYVHARARDGPSSGNVSIFQTRVQWYF